MSEETRNDHLTLFSQLAAGDQTAFTELFYHYSPRLLPFLVKKVNDPAIAEELLQDIFVKLWTHRANFENLDNPEGYLYRIAANRALDHFKKRAHEERMKRSAASVAINVAAPVEYREVERVAREAIVALPAQRKNIYELREQGFSYQEIADHLKISVNTVRNQLVEASKFIRDYLLKRGIGPMLLIQWMVVQAATHTGFH